MTSASSRLPAMTATWKKDGEEWGKQSQKRSKRPHKSERRKALLQEIPFATAGRTSSVTRERTLVRIGATVTHVRTHATHHGVVLSTTVSNGSVHTQAERMMACRESIKRWQSSPKHYLPMHPRWLWSPFKGGLRDDFCGSWVILLPTRIQCSCPLACYIILQNVH